MAARHSSGSEDTRLSGYLVEFETPGGLLRACEEVRDHGFSRWDAHSPFPGHGLDAAMGLKPTILPWVVAGGGATGCGLGLLLQWWTNAHDYPFLISGKPFFGIPAVIPVTFELTILLSAFGAFFGMLLLNGFPRFHHAVFSSQRFRRVTQDRFFISVEARDPKFDANGTKAFLSTLGGTRVERLEG